MLNACVPQVNIISVTATRRQLLEQTGQEQGLGMAQGQGLVIGQGQGLVIGQRQVHVIHPPDGHRQPRELQTAGGLVVVYTVTVAGTSSSSDPNTPAVSAASLTSTLQSPSALAAVTSNLAQSYPEVTVAAPVVVNISPTSAPTSPPTIAPSAVNNNLVFGTTLTLIPFALAVGLPSLFVLLVLCYGLWTKVYPNYKCNYISLLINISTDPYRIPSPYVLIHLNPSL